MRVQTTNTNTHMTYAYNCRKNMPYIKEPVLMLKPLHYPSSMRSPHRCPWPPLQGTLDSRTFWTCKETKCSPVPSDLKHVEVFHTLPPTTLQIHCAPSKERLPNFIVTPNANMVNIGIPKNPPIAQLEQVPGFESQQIGLSCHIGDPKWLEQAPENETISDSQAKK